MTRNTPSLTVLFALLAACSSPAPTSPPWPRAEPPTPPMALDTGLPAEGSVLPTDSGGPATLVPRVRETGQEDSGSCAALAPPFDRLYEREGSVNCWDSGVDSGLYVHAFCTRQLPNPSHCLPYEDPFTRPDGCEPAPRQLAVPFPSRRPSGELELWVDGLLVDRYVWGPEVYATNASFVAGPSGWAPHPYLGNPWSPGHLAAGEAEVRGDGLRLAELLLIPQAGLAGGDINCDAALSPDLDRFIELVHLGASALDLATVRLTDDAGAEITLPAGVLAPGERVVLVPRDDRDCRLAPLTELMEGSSPGGPPSNALVWGVARTPEGSELTSAVWDNRQVVLERRRLPEPGEVLTSDPIVSSVAWGGLEFGYAPELVADLDGDGEQDLLIVRSEDFQWAPGPWEADLPPRSLGSFWGSFLARRSMGDLDGDGREELAVHQPAWMGPGWRAAELDPATGRLRVDGPEFRETCFEDYQGVPAPWPVGDLDGDGLPDVVMHRDENRLHQISVFLAPFGALNTTDDAAAVWVDDMDGRSWGSVLSLIAPLDTEGSGYPDLLVFDQHGSAQVLDNGARGRVPSSAAKAHLLLSELMAVLPRRPDSGELVLVQEGDPTTLIGLNLDRPGVYGESQAWWRAVVAEPAALRSAGSKAFLGEDALGRGMLFLSASGGISSYGPLPD